MERVLFVCVCFPLSRVFKHKGSPTAATLRKAAKGGVLPNLPKGEPGDRFLVQVGSPALAGNGRNARGISEQREVWKP